MTRRVWSRVGLGWGCGQEQEEQAEGVALGRRIRLRVWSRAR